MASPLAILKSDSTVGKFVFLILLLILFIYTLRIVSSIISYIFAPNPSPVLIKGMRRATKGLVIEQDPKVSGSKTIMRSENEEGGIEFTWTLWTFIENVDPAVSTTIRHVFHKGNKALSETGTFQPNNAPGLYIDKLKPSSVNDKGMKQCNMFVLMNTYKEIEERIDIENIPLKKWIFIAIRVRGRTLDVYLNGIIAARHELQSPVKQNYGNVYVTQKGGYNGAISSLQYHNEALDAQTIFNMSNDGADTDMYDEDDMQQSDPPYLSLKWYHN